MSIGAANLRAIAEAAGVSRMTVSRALRNHPNVNAKTRDRIVEIANQLGYHPNPLVSTLMADIRTKRTQPSGQVLAFITAHETADRWRDLYTTRQFYEGAHEQARRLGYKLEPFWLFDKWMDAPRLSRILYARGINGIIIAPLPDHPIQLDLDWSKFAAVCMGYSLRSPALHHVANHQYKTMRMVIQELRRRGYQKIGLCLAVDDDQRVLNLWRAGFLVEESVHPPAVTIPILIMDSIGAGFKPFRAWVRRHRPDVIVSIHECVLTWIANLGLTVPGDIGFAHLGISEEMFGRIAGVDQNSRTAGAAAVDVIVGQHHRNERGIPMQPKSVLMEGTWMEGVTLKQPSSPPPRAKPNELA